jgi:NAD-dependent dihydropyrimidine dehydrogenase PreA subunit
MCEFCTQHGEGKKWYLNMENYSRDLLEQEGRREYMARFLNTFAERTPPGIRQLESLARTPLMGPARSILNRRQKRNHYGQVVPIEEIEQILGQVEGVIRLPCVCRRVTTGNMNARFCYGLTLDERLSAALDDSFSLEILSKDEAITAIRKLDKEGLMHSVWTFKTPYIGGICNCDQDCMAHRVTYARGYYPVMFRGEYVAAVDLDACNGCKNCMRQCQYGAIRFSATNKKVVIDPRACYGCGVCRAACHHDAIALHARLDDPIAANIW